MVPRRQLLGGAVMSGVVGVLAPASAEADAAGEQRGGDQDMSEVVRALDRIRSEIQNHRTFSEIALVREAQKAFLRVNGKMPDFIEVGSDVWFGAYDWHVRWQQPLSVGRDPLGRYTLALTQSLLILRSEMQSGYVGTPYDSR
jgi:hypothetical protein